MEQKDYILREIEKMAAILGAIRQKLFGGSDNLSLSVEKQFDETKDMLLNFNMSFINGKNISDLNVCDELNRMVLKRVYLHLTDLPLRLFYLPPLENLYHIHTH